MELFDDFLFDDMRRERVACWFLARHEIVEELYARTDMRQDLQVMPLKGFDANYEEADNKC